ncbi:benzoylformate decarboxylase [Beauveria brongniartii RCEF 3172]|uniref:Benzoylformate decarboxylase n=1 Tax=Beauveria brongniartii RCEF 3172 TaxID=1081107 RepID=A0A167H0E0_9HYPO|nr:benzoylformate decarboxylase [Beauveria brongniartii RCEF 3172]
MIATTIRTPPSLADFLPLAEYQSQTPESFVDGKPVLHLHIVGAAASAPKEQVAGGALAVFPANSPVAAAADAEELVEQQVDVYVTSEYVYTLPAPLTLCPPPPPIALANMSSLTRTFTIFSPAAEAGVSIPYPSISIHAIKQLPSSSHAVWMQLELSDGGSSDDDNSRLIELTIVPPAASDTDTASKLYEAIATCSNLHPDPAGAAADDDDNDYQDRIVFEGSAERHEALEGFQGVLRGAADGGLPPPMPGSGGWITAENVSEYFDDEGNWIGPGAEVGGEEEGAAELGEGAGRTRARDEIEVQEGINGHGAEEDAESKRQRVE